LRVQLEETATAGSILSTDDEKRRFSAASGEFNLKNSTFCELFPEVVAAACAIHPRFTSGLSKQIAAEIKKERAAAAAAAAASTTKATAATAAAAAGPVDANQKPLVVAKQCAFYLQSKPVSFKVLRYRRNEAAGSKTLLNVAAAVVVAAFCYAVQQMLQSQ
jgi:hypothetical protein